MANFSLSNYTDVMKSTKKASSLKQPGNTEQLGNTEKTETLNTNFPKKQVENADYLIPH